MYRHTLTIPHVLNDGARVSPSDVDHIESVLVDIAGGFTRADGVGTWRDDSTGAIYREGVSVYTIDADRDITAPLRQLAEWCALALAQECVYVTRSPINARYFVAAPTLETEGV